MRSTVRSLLAAAILAALSCGYGGPARPPSAAAVAAVPVAFADIEGIRAELRARRRAGRPVLVNFWATWCEPCVEELPELAGLSREYADSGPDVLGVSLDAFVIGSEPEAEKKVREVLARSGVTYGNLIYHGDRDPLAGGFNLPGSIPYSILYDGGGRVITTWTGKIAVGKLRQAVAGLR